MIKKTLDQWTRTMRNITVQILFTLQRIINISFTSLDFCVLLCNSKFNYVSKCSQHVYIWKKLAYYMNIFWQMLVSFFGRMVWTPNTQKVLSKCIWTRAVQLAQLFCWNMLEHSMFIHCLMVTFRMSNNLYLNLIISLNLECCWNICNYYFIYIHTKITENKNEY